MAADDLAARLEAGDQAGRAVAAFYEVKLAESRAEIERLQGERDEALKLAEDSWRLAWAKAQRDWEVKVGVTAPDGAMEVNNERGNT